MKSLFLLSLSLFFSSFFLTLKCDRLQSHLSEAIEKCWSEGFDPSGAKVFQGKLRNTKGEIGVTDVAALLRSFGIKYVHLPSL